MIAWDALNILKKINIIMLKGLYHFVVLVFYLSKHFLKYIKVKNMWNNIKNSNISMEYIWHIKKVNLIRLVIRLKELYLFSF